MCNIALIHSIGYRFTLSTNRSGDQHRVHVQRIAFSRNMQACNVQACMLHLHFEFHKVDAKRLGIALPSSFHQTPPDLWHWGCKLNPNMKAALWGLQ